MADFCVFWVRRAHDHLPMCTPDDPLAGRAGLVGTQNIRNNQSRVGGLDHVAAGGTVVDAVENQPWSGEANVHVSIANWVKHAGLTQQGGSRDPPRGARALDAAAADGQEEAARPQRGPGFEGVRAGAAGGGLDQRRALGRGDGERSGGASGA